MFVDVAGEWAMNCNQQIWKTKQNTVTSTNIVANGDNHEMLNADEEQRKRERGSGEWNDVKSVY